MYEEFVLIDSVGAPARRWQRLALGATGGRNEAWLRDLVLGAPDIVPVREIDPAFGPLVPLCTELRTEAGAIDAAFINRDGKLTIVETKLWRNPEARREVVAQTLDYARTLTRWSYSDLQRQVSARTRLPGNVPLERVRAVYPDVVEQDFIDATARCLRAGRFLIIIMGDGIREDVEAIAELINRNAAAAFQLAVVETALYDAGGGDVAVQARILARTRLIERVVISSANGDALALAEADNEAATSSAPIQRDPQIRAWWNSVLEMAFDDPDQPRPLCANNYVRSALPWPALFIGAYRTVKSDETAVYLGGPERAKRDFFHALGTEIDELREDIPEAVVQLQSEPSVHRLWVPRRSGEFPSDDAHRAWIIETINVFANGLRPRMKRLLERRSID